MIISPGRRYIFVHIPKTGGTAMALALEDRAQANDILIGDTPKARRRRGRLKRLAARGRLWKHATLADLDGLMKPEEMSASFTFTLVRNPWDRMVSYYHWLRMQTFDHPAVHLAHAVDFKSFVAAPATLGALRAHPARQYMTAADGQEHCRLFIRLEHVDTDAEPLWAHLGFRLCLRHVNRSDRGDYRTYYDADTARLVGRLIRADPHLTGL